MSQISPISGVVTATTTASAAPDPAPASATNGPTAQAAGPASASASTSTPAKTSPPAAAPTPDQRLLIQETSELGVFVYTVVDRASGAVITQIPYKQMENLGAQDNYASGQVISTTA